jgi:hypothetical protein
MKLKECSQCHEMTYLWKSSPRLCKPCALKISSSKPRSSDDSSNPPKPHKSSPNRIKPVSDKKLLELKEYRKLRDGYLKANPVCEFAGCTSREVTLHHKSGRVGKLLTDSRYFCSLCIKHHSWAEENPLEAKQLGLSLSRLETTKKPSH